MGQKEKYIKKLFLITIGFAFFTEVVNSQTYGLHFQSYKNGGSEERTSLDLTPGMFLSLEEEFEISFDYKIDTKEPKDIFGYVFRIINEDNINVDLISTPNPSPNLNVVIGKNNALIPVRYPKNAYNNWIKLRVKFNTNEDKLIIYTRDSSYVQNDIGFKKKDAYKIIFGLNTYPGFITTDVPSMDIRNVKLFERGQLKHEWLLDENSGNSAIDLLDNHKAAVKNPVWLMKTHQEWQTDFEQEIDGNIIVASDDKNSRIFMLGNTAYYMYSVSSNTTKRIAYKNKPLFLTTSHRIIYNHTDNKIYCYLVDGGPRYSLDIETQKWDNVGAFSDFKTKYKQHNSFYNASDNSIYLFGGYGRHFYNSEVRKIDLTKKTWNDLPTNDTIFHPRYLSGLGSLNETIYILGGFGSVTGNQSINPSSYYDLLAYSIKDSSWVKKYDLPHVIENMLIGSSFVIDSIARDYYALAFNKNITKPNIQLIRGNLDAPELEFVGNKIPVTFHDVKSYVSLFYPSDQEKLIAYTSYFNESGKTEVKILSIKYPPNKLIGKTVLSKKENVATYLYFLLLFLLLGGLAIWFYARKKKQKIVTPNASVPFNEALIENNLNTFIENQKSTPKNISYNVVLFGGFQVFNDDFVDVTNRFSPLLKELFLLILLHTLKNNKGISPEKLTEILWYDKSEKSARNNRSVNMARLRGILREVGSCELSKETGYWKIKLENTNFKSDYVNFLNITSSKDSLTKQSINYLIDITQKGAFLSNVQYDWLDGFKATVSDLIVDTLVAFASNCDTTAEAEFIIHIADSIFNFDIINEEALILKCRAQYSLGKYSHSKKTYEKFFKEYLKMYGQEYDTSFVTILDIKE